MSCIWVLSQQEECVEEIEQTLRLYFIVHGEVDHC